MGQLIDAIKDGDEDRVVALVASDPQSAGEQDDSGVSAVLQALYRGQRGMVTAITAAKGSLDVFEAAALGDLEQLGAALAAEPRAPACWSGDGFTPLHLAAFFGHREAVNVLLEAGADADAEGRNPSRVRPLHSAVAGPEPMIAEALVEHGVDVDAAQEGGWTALHSAAFHGNRPLVDVLLGAHAHPTPVASNGLTPAQMARAEGHGELADHLDSASGVSSTL